MESLHAQEKIKDYTLLRGLGSGTSGIVWKAEKAGRPYAIKFFKPGFADYATEEFDLMQRVEHPAIIDEYELGVHDGTTYLVMDYLEGMPLDQADPTTFTPQEVERIARDLAAGLQHAHAQEIVHRDLKPANIFLTPQQTVKILDFGASAPISYHPHEKLVAGSYSYMSPEQLAGRANFQNDIWSYGVTLYRFLTGIHPYQSNHIEDLSEKMLLLEVAFPHHVNPAIDPKISYVIMKCLRKNVPDRYRSFTEVLADLNGDIVGDIVQKFGGRRRMLRRLRFAEKSLRVSQNVESGTNALGCLATPLSIFSGINLAGLFQMINAGIVRVFRLKSRRKISIGEDLMKVALLYDAPQFTSLIERIDKYRHQNRRGTATREYLLYWHWQNGRRAEAEELANELLEINPQSLPALSFYTNWHYQAGDSASAIASCRQLMRLNPGDASSFFFEKVLLRDGAEVANPLADADALAATIVKATNTGPTAGGPVTELNKEIAQYGFVRLPIEITQYNFHHLVERAGPEETSTGRRIISRMITVPADLVLHNDYLELRPDDQTAEQRAHIINAGFALPETVAYSEIVALALAGNVVQFRENGWFTLRFSEPIDRVKWRDFVLATATNLSSYGPAVEEALKAADTEKTREKNTARRRLALIGSVVLLVVLNAIADVLPGEIVFVLLFLIYLIAGEIWRTLLAFYIFAWKKLKLRRWLRQIRYDGPHFLAFFSLLLRHGMLPQAEQPVAPLPAPSPQSLSIALADQQLSYRNTTLAFAEISAIQISDQWLYVLVEGKRKLSFRHRGTAFAEYLPGLLEGLGEKVELG